MSIRKTKLKGASWHSGAKKWRSRITIAGEKINLGYYDTEEEASEAYNKAYTELVLPIKIQRRNRRKLLNMEWNRRNPDKVKNYAKKTKQNLRKEIIANYGGECVCCGESREEFMAIDHINGGGNKHKKELKRTGNNFYVWLKRNNWPKDRFRLLCHNCNCSRGFYGYCPHEKERKDISHGKKELGD